MTRTVLWAVGIVALFVVAGVACGLFWQTRLDTPAGVVVGGHWYPDPSVPGQQESFASTGWYVVIAACVAVLLGLTAAWLSRASEIVTLAAVLAGSLVAAWLMLVVGLHGAPPDPAAAARHAADGARLTGTISRPGRAAFVTWPLVAVAAVGAVFLLFGERRETREIAQEEASSRDRLPPHRPAD